MHSIFLMKPMAKGNVLMQYARRNFTQSLAHLRKGCLEASSNELKVSLCTLQRRAMQQSLDQVGLITRRRAGSAFVGSFRGLPQKTVVIPAQAAPRKSLGVTKIQTDFLMCSPRDGCRCSCPFVTHINTLKAKNRIHITAYIKCLNHFYPSDVKAVTDSSSLQSYPPSTYGN